MTRYAPIIGQACIHPFEYRQAVAIGESNGRKWCSVVCLSCGDIVSTKIIELSEVYDLMQDRKEMQEEDK